MALIKCPECGKEISDRSVACIHCGFPLELLENKVEQKGTHKLEDDVAHIEDNAEGYSLELLDYSNKKIQVALILKNNLAMKDGEALELVASAPCYLFKGQKEDKAVAILDKLNSLPVEYKLYVDGKLKRHKTKIEIETRKVNHATPSTAASSYTKKISCPNCRSLISESSKECPYCGYNQIGTYLLHLEREKQEKIIANPNNYGGTNVSSIQNNTPKCPTCQSTNIKKISSLSKAGSVAMWGIFSQKVRKQWHCNNCGSEW